MEWFTVFLGIVLAMSYSCHVLYLCMVVTPLLHLMLLLLHQCSQLFSVHGWRRTVVSCAIDMFNGILVHIKGEGPPLHPCCHHGSMPSLLPKILRSGRWSVTSIMDSHTGIGGNDISQTPGPNPPIQSVHKHVQAWRACMMHMQWVSDCHHSLCAPNTCPNHTLMHHKIV